MKSLLSIVGLCALLVLVAALVHDVAPPAAAAVAGDVDCDGDVDSVDALKELRHVAVLPVSQSEPCPDIGTEVASIFGDVDCDDDVDAVDALKILRSVAALPISQGLGCGPIGSPLSPAAGAYELVQTLESATFDRMLGFSTIPGAEAEAVVVTQGGVIWRVSLGGGPTSVFGDLSQLITIDTSCQARYSLGLAYRSRVEPATTLAWRPLQAGPTWQLPRARYSSFPHDCASGCEA